MFVLTSTADNSMYRTTVFLNFYRGSAEVLFVPLDVCGFQATGRLDPKYWAACGLLPSDILWHTCAHRFKMSEDYSICPVNSSVATEFNICCLRLIGVSKQQEKPQVQSIKKKKKKKRLIQLPCFAQFIITPTEYAQSMPSQKSKSHDFTEECTCRVN